MDADTPVIRWRRSGAGHNSRQYYTLWHVDVPVPADATGRTACGRRYPRAHAEAGTAGDGVLCRNCVAALGGAVPGKETETESED